MTKLEDQLKSLILQHVEFKLNDKVVKKGRVKVFNTKQFFIKFKLEMAEGSKDYELPYPYKVIPIKNGFIFDYCLSAFCPKTEENYWRMRTMNRSDASKIHENYLIVVALSG